MRSTQVFRLLPGDADLVVATAVACKPKAHKTSPHNGAADAANGLERTPASHDSGNATVLIPVPREDRDRVTGNSYSAFGVAGNEDTLVTSGT